MRQFDEGIGAWAALTGRRPADAVFDYQTVKWLRSLAS